ncbi:hypothetical protein [Acetatifactor muris]|uniref:hypothetical protein n=1 Tax=Acetatifactor muris TaxID=879566 RepID=UPI0023F2948E|nr:hypothetical protein [Acetatifactor muris]
MNKRIFEREIRNRTHFLLLLVIKRATNFWQYRKLIAKLDVHDCLIVAGRIELPKRNSRSGHKRKRRLSAGCKGKPSNFGAGDKGVRCGENTAWGNGQQFPNRKNWGSIETKGMADGGMALFLVSSHPLNASELPSHARKEWSVESMHWLLDVHYGKDFCRIRIGQSNKI